MNKDDMHLTTESAEARSHLDNAMQGMCLWKADFMNDIKSALTADPDFAMAHAVRALALSAGRHVRFLPMMRSGLEKAKAGNVPLSAHENGYIEALEHAVNQRPDLAIATYRKILDEHPCDMFVHRLAQQELFNFGRMNDMYEVAEKAAPKPKDEGPTKGEIVTALVAGGFVHAETGASGANKDFLKEVAKRSGVAIA